MHRAVRSTATVRNANRIGRRMAGGRANVNGFLLGRNMAKDRSAARRKYQLRVASRVSSSVQPSTTMTCRATA